MAFNPSNSTVESGKTAGVTPVNPQSDVKVHTSQGLNDFTMSYQNLLTARYGEITPFFIFDAIGRDRVNLSSSHEVRTTTLQSPMMSSLRMRKTYASMPYSGILPNTWQYIFTNPKKGDDVPDDVFPMLSISDITLQLTSRFAKNSPFNIDSDLFHRFLLFYSIFSSGGLLNYLGCHINPSRTIPISTFEGYVDSLISQIGKSTLVGKSIRFNLGNNNSVVNPTSKYQTLTFTANLEDNRRIFYAMIQHPDYSLVSNQPVEIPADSLLAWKSIVEYLNGVSLQQNPFSENINVSRLVAYQQICAQYYTNDNVDSLYSAELYMSNQKSLCYMAYDKVSTAPKFFKYNGVPVYYDVFSFHFLTALCDALDSTISPGTHDSEDTYTSGDYAFLFFMNLFTFRESLKYADYFMAGRTRPLAVGDVEIQVNNKPGAGMSVSAIDVNHNLWIQRFLNAVNRTASNIIEYTKSIFGYDVPKDYHTPNFILTNSEFISGVETTNTASEQGDVTLNIKSQNSRYEFDVFIDNPCIIFGLCSFEFTPCYDKGISRFFFHKDRFDMFNPYLQHIGDQEIYVSEYDSESTGEGNVPFAYAERYAEYKHRVNEAHGGFSYNLPSWSFLTSYGKSPINSDVVRCHPYEMDKYYKELSYSGLAGYYHFIISFMNNCDTLRAMNKYPDLL